VRRRVLPFLAAALLAAGPALADTMPQLQFGNPLLRAQVVWGAIIFVLFYFAASRLALPRVTEVLETRSRAIAADLDRARADKRAADAARDAFETARREARARAEAEVAEAARQAKAEAAARAAADEARLEARLAESEGRIEAARRTALGALREVAGDTAQTLIARLTGREPDHAAVQAALGRALTARELG
jgi:F-type H+-transporting ATPase subunit b